MARDGIEATPEAIAERIQVPVRDVQQMLVRLDGHGETSIDAPVTLPVSHQETQISGHEVVADVLTSDDNLPSNLLERAQFESWFNGQLRKFEKTLEQRELSVFSERWLSDHPTTKKDLSVRHGVCEERIRQIEVSLRRRLKNFLEAADGGLQSHGIMVRRGKAA